MHRAITGVGLMVCALMLPASARAAGAASGHAHASKTTASLSITASGTAVGTYPDFDPSVHRYAITTTDATDGRVGIAVTGGQDVTVDGRPTTATTMTGLTAGDEIGIRADRASYSFVYLPAGFPALKVTADQGGLQKGYVALTLNKFAGDGSPTYDAIVDRQGVPVWVEQESAIGDLDLKRQDDGSLTVMRPTSAGDELVTLDGQYRPTGTPRTTTGLGNTDGHDSWVFGDDNPVYPRGSTILIASVPNARTGLTDARIQIVKPGGAVAFHWTTAALPTDESLFSINGTDYAHINSVWPLADGDLVVSFRHFSSVFRIATTAHDGHQPGDVVWELGGRHSTFTFPDAGFQGGPCAQHTASDWTDSHGREHVMVFDDGSNSLSKSICLNPDDPDGPAIQRPQTRVTEYVLDPVDHTANVAWSYQVPGVSTTFAGSAYRMPNGDTLIGWAATPHAIASEVSARGDLLWQLEDTAAGTAADHPYVTYRAMLVTAPDQIQPAISVTAPAEAHTYPAFASPADYACSDRGGSNLVGCSLSDSPGGWAPGGHTLTFTATDGAGNLTRTVRHITLATGYWPEAAAAAEGHTAGANTHGSWKRQLVRVRLDRGGTVKARVRLTNGGSRPDRFRLAGNAGTRTFSVRYVVEGAAHSRSIEAGTFRTPRVAPGKTIVVTLAVRRLSHARRGDAHRFHLTATSTHDASRSDGAGVAVAAR